MKNHKPNNVKQIFMLGLVVGMILAGIILIFFFVFGQARVRLPSLSDQNNYAPYFKTKTKGLFTESEHQPLYRIKKIERDGQCYLYILEGIKPKPSQKPDRHPNRKAVKVAPM
jgi:hypothetical protein